MKNLHKTIKVTLEIPVFSYIQFKLHSTKQLSRSQQNSREGQSKDVIKKTKNSRNVSNKNKRQEVNSKKYLE